ncbi:MAG TPA: pitrilysin family protein [Candidatus Eisenbacteria bacterium]|nr:pitrilysin family protein [Candidatus Eisenbacteria bacterium]
MSDVVALHLWVGVGGRDELPGERGFSHFAEHMLFKGTSSRGAGFVDRDIEAVGGRTNAGTSWDYTFYYILLPASRAAQGIDILSDMAFNSVFDPVELAREREVVFEEMRLGEDNLRNFLGRRLFYLTFRGESYGQAVLGDREMLRASSQETLRGYYKRHYVPDNMTLVVVGAVDPAAVRAAVTRAFASVPAQGHRRAIPPAPRPLDDSYREVRARPERQASLALGWLAPPLGASDMFAADLLVHILGGSQTSRLNQALRERQQLVSSVRASYSALQGAGMIGISALFEPDDLDKVEAAVLAEVKRLQDEGVTQAERDRAVTAAESRHVFSIETAEGRAYAYGMAETLWTLEGELKYLDGIRAVTREQIQAAARTYLGTERARLALLPRDKVR